MRDPEAPSGALPPWSNHAAPSHAVGRAGIRQAHIVAARIAPRAVRGPVAARLAESRVSKVVVAEVLAGYLAAADRHQRALLVVFELVRI